MSSQRTGATYRAASQRRGRPSGAAKSGATADRALRFDLASTVGLRGGIQCDGQPNELGAEAEPKERSDRSDAPAAPRAAKLHVGHCLIWRLAPYTMAELLSRIPSPRIPSPSSLSECSLARLSSARALTPTISTGRPGNQIAGSGEPNNARSIHFLSRCREAADRLQTAAFRRTDQEVGTDALALPANDQFKVGF